ncbi:GGDEF domain-containing protein [Evansella clarkii]|uniref:GGDEF domain-containing protein n=1 Tax=Evansella clarkii TaxID=79879 RepID=UPI001F22F323|nr:GGDEF domain-containing protein [Evansella clarkii]
MKVKLYIFSLFAASLLVAFSSGPVQIESTTFLTALIIYLFFSIIYYNMRIFQKKGGTTTDYGISYSMSFALFTGPLGLLIYEFLYRLSSYIMQKSAKRADPDEFLHIFYNAGSFVLVHSAGYYLYQFLLPYFQPLPFGVWLLLILLVIITSFLTDFIISILFYLLGEITTREEAFHFFKDRSRLDMAKTAFTNGFLLLFLIEGRWELLVSLFILNYIVNQSFHTKTQSLQAKEERDKFRKMAYTDFLTGLYNRAFMDKKMEQLNQTKEQVGVIVADIDNFKRINDDYNHAAGDSVIRHFAQTLASTLSKDDYLFRSGGEEFAVFLRNRSFEEMAELAEKMRREVASGSAEAEFKGETTPISYTSSFGLYCFTISEKMPMEKAFIRADHLLIEAKRNGKNRVTAESPQPAAATVN